MASPEEQIKPECGRQEVSQGLEVSQVYWLSNSLGEVLTVCAKSLSHVRLLATLWTVACQAPLSMEFSRKECWSGLSCPSPRGLPSPGLNPGSPVLQQILYCLSHLGSPTSLTVRCILASLCWLWRTSSRALCLPPTVQNPRATHGGWTRKIWRTDFFKWLKCSKHDF